MQSNILIVDDSIVDRNLIGRIIMKNIPEAEIYESKDGMNLKAMLLEFDIKVCILDLKMPLIDGYSVLEEIKNDLDLMDIPIIVCTGMRTVDSLEKVLMLGAYDYFSKPLTEEAMKISLPIKVRNAIDLMNRTKHIVHLSRIDSLTGLYNRAYFKSHLKKTSLMNQLPASIMMADINGLKMANDAYGSELGDRFLIALAGTLKEVFPENAVIARWGGDEFAVYLQDTEKCAIETYAKTIRKRFGVVEYNGLKLSMACGWDMVYDAEQDLSKSLINAEDVMFRNKVLEDVSIRSSMIGTILHTLHEKNPREEAHSRRVSDACCKLCAALKFSDEEIQEVRIIGLLHDIGKIAIDEHILNKPGYLTQAQWMEIRRHPEIGYRLLSSSPGMKAYADAILCHHERIDGNGYPNHLKGDDIPLHARILSIADSYDAMTCERTYRPMISVEEAAAELLANAGTQFDSILTEVFITKVLGLSLDTLENEGTIYGTI